MEERPCIIHGNSGGGLKSLGGYTLTARPANTPYKASRDQTVDARTTFTGDYRYIEIQAVVHSPNIAADNRDLVIVTVTAADGTKVLERTYLHSLNNLQVGNTAVLHDAFLSPKPVQKIDVLVRNERWQHSGTTTCTIYTTG